MSKRLDRRRRMALASARSLLSNLATTSMISNRAFENIEGYSGGLVSPNIDGAW